jgi:autotransporter translocation and assembly factor TamB
MVKTLLRRLLKITVYSLLGIVLILGVLWVFRAQILAGPVSRLIEGRLEAATGVRIRIGELSGTWLGGVDVHDVVVVEIAGLHAIEAASVRRVSASWSLLGLVLGRDGCIERVELEGVRAVLNLDLMAASDARSPEDGDADAGDPGVFVPGIFAIRDVELTVRAGPRRLRASGLEIEGSATGLDRGRAGLRLRELTVEDPEGAEKATDLTLEAVLEDGKLEIHCGLGRGPGRIRLDLVAGEVWEKTRSLTGEIVLEDLRPGPVLDALLAKHDASLALLNGRLTLEGVRHVDGVPSGVVWARCDLKDLTIAGRSIESATLSVEGPLDGMTVDLSVFGPHGKIDATGKAGIDGNFDIEGIASLPDLAGLDLDLGGRVPGGSVEASGRLRSAMGVLFLARAQVDGRCLTLDDRSVGDVHIEAVFEQDVIALRRFTCVRGADRLTLSGTVSMEDDHAIDLSGDLSVESLVEIGELAGLKLAGAIAGTVALNGPVEDPSGHLDISGEGLRFDSIEVNRFGLRVTVAPGRLEIPNLTVVTPDGSIDLTAEADRLGWRDFTGTLTRLDLSYRDESATLETPAAISIGGDGTLSLDSLRLFGDALSLGIRGERAPAGGLDCALEVTRLDLAVLGRHLDLDTPLTGLLNLDLRMTGTQDDPALAASLDLGPSTVGVENEVLNLVAAQIRLEAGPDEVRLSDLRVETNAGTIRGRGRVVLPASILTHPLPSPGRLRIGGHIEADALRLDRIAGIFPDIDLAGVLSLEIDCDGTLAALRPTGFVRLANGRCRGVPGLPAIDDIEIDVTADPETVTIERLSAKTAGATVAGQGKLDLVDLEPDRIRFTLTARADDLRATARGLDLTGLDDLAGRSEVTVTLDGPVSGPEIGIRGTVRDLVMNGEGPARLDLEAGISGGRARLTRLDIVSSRGTIDAAAELGAQIELWPLHVRTDPLVEGSYRIATEGLLLDDLDRLLPATAGVRHLEGRVDFSFRHDAGGILERPRGDLRLRGLTVRLQGQRRGIQNLDADLTVGDGRIDLTRLEARVGHAPIDVIGWLDLTNDAWSYHADVSGTRLLLLDGLTARLRSDLDLAVDGVAGRDALITGTVRLRDLLYTENVRYLDLKSRPTVAPLPLVADGPLARTRLDLRIVAPDGLKVANNVLRAQLAADLRVRGTVAYPEVDGRVRALEGRLTIPGASLRIETADLDFRPAAPLRPEISFLGSTTRRRIRIEVTASGPLDALVIDMTSDPSMPRDDVLTLLTTGVLASEVTAEKAGEAIALAGAGYLLDEFLGSSEATLEEEETTFQRLKREVTERTEVSQDNVPGGRGTIVTATVRLLDWLHLQGERTELGEYNLDVVFRVLGR